MDNLLTECAKKKLQRIYFISFKHHTEVYVKQWK